jgi:hypothetical protein
MGTSSDSTCTALRFVQTSAHSVPGHICRIGGAYRPWGRHLTRHVLRFVQSSALSLPGLSSRLTGVQLVRVAHFESIETMSWFKLTPSAVARVDRFACNP